MTRADCPALAADEERDHCRAADWRRQLGDSASSDSDPARLRKAVLGPVDTGEVADPLATAVHRVGAAVPSLEEPGRFMPHRHSGLVGVE